MQQRDKKEVCMKGSYEELSPAMQEQVDAATLNILKNTTAGIHFDRLDIGYMREHIANVVLTCLFIDKKPKKEVKQ